MNIKNDQQSGENEIEAELTDESGEFIELDSAEMQKNLPQSEPQVTIEGVDPSFEPIILPPLLIDDEPESERAVNESKNYNEANPMAEFTLAIDETYRFALGKERKVPFMDFSLDDRGFIIIKNPETGATIHHPGGEISIDRPMSQEEIDSIGIAFRQAMAEEKRRENFSKAAQPAQDASIPEQQIITPNLIKETIGRNFCKDIFPEEASTYLSNHHCRIFTSPLSPQGTVKVSVVDGALETIDLSTGSEGLRRSTHGTFFKKINTANGSHPDQTPLPRQLPTLEELEFQLLPNGPRQPTPPAVESLKRSSHGPFFEKIKGAEVATKAPEGQLPIATPAKVETSITYVSAPPEVPIPASGGTREIPEYVKNFTIFKTRSQIKNAQNASPGPFDYDECRVFLKQDEVVFQIAFQEIGKDGKVKIKETELSAKYGQEVAIVNKYILDLSKPVPDSVKKYIRSQLEQVTDPTVRKFQQPMAFKVDRLRDKKTGKQTVGLINRCSQDLSIIYPLI
ncbi:MAG: hypothetical protein PHP74_00280 [Candidatus Gracilibacteria bacterium]|nr:hypothetical protein [Candidatus Gracilibacteria bacterium]